jgi:small subunit ribosomal protein S4
MSRYTGPRRRVVRRLGVPLDGLTRKGPGTRTYPPGQHGPSTRRRKAPSEYGLRLLEKQKLRYYYGLTETQLRNYVKRAARQSGPTGSNLLALLERRLDNIVFRLGLAPTIAASRQLVSHGHINVNGQRVSAPGFEANQGDVIEARESSRAHPLVAEGAVNGPTLANPSYLERAADHFGGRVTGTPERAAVPMDLRESLIVEFYAR